MDNFEGIYKFYLDDQLVYEQKNALTVVGRAIVMKSLLGIIPNIANAIGYGIGDKPNSILPSSNLISDNSLQFEVGKTSVNGSSIGVNNNIDSLIYSGVIQDPSEYFIYEVGLFPSVISDAFLGIRSSNILNFNEISNFTQFGTASAAHLSAYSAARIGTDMIFVPQMNGTDGYLRYNSNSGELNYLDIFTAEDIFKVAGFNIGGQSSSIVFRMHSDESNYYELIFNTPSASGYFILEKEKYQASIIGSPEWSNLNYIIFWQTGNTEGVLLDGFKISTGSYLVDTNTGMISRAVLDSPIRKPASLPLTIEYTLNIGFNEGF